MQLKWDSKQKLFVLKKKMMYMLEKLTNVIMEAIFIDKFVEEHNHTLNSQELLHQFAPSLRTTILKRILRKKFPDQEIYHQDLYNMIHKFKTDAQIKNDAVILYEHLMKLQQEDSDWYFNVDFEGIKVEKEEQAVTECGICKSWYHDPKLSFKEQ
ncbi:unnamed protein product [Rhizophagus irregularis]|nr:unnamed protein product [Rhizophagus irregularis]